MARSPRRAGAAELPEEEDEDDVLDIGTAVAIATLQGLIASGMEPAEAVKVCWRAPVDFMVARRAWWAAVQEAYQDD